MKHEIYKQNRELSWLRFNERVLEEANDKTVPLLERLKFVSIFTSNLDEFFMIRVGILFKMAEIKKHWKDNKCQMTASEQLDAIFSETSKLYKKKDSTYSQIKSELSEQGIEFVAYKKCNKEEKKFLKEYYQDNILPLLSPQIVDARHPTPNLQSKISYIVASLKNKNKNILGLVQCPATIPEIIPIGDDSKRFIFAEELIVEHIDEIFSMYKISDKNIICITRNGDLTTDEETDGSEDYRNQMKLILKKRRVSFIVRVEAAKSLSSELEEFILRTLKVQKKQIFVTSAPLKMKFPFSLPEILPVELSGKLSYPLFDDFANF